MTRIIFAAILLLLPSCVSFAQERDLMPWARDFREAAEMAARERKLILLHFWADDCLPCRRVEANVFTREEVAGAVKTAFIPLKVHAGQSPELARRYQVVRWPTDVIVTPAGLEVYRTVSPQEPIKYIAMLSDVARQSGSALASNLQPAVNSVAREQAGALANAIQNQIGPYQPATAPPATTTPPATTPGSANSSIAGGASPAMANPYMLGANPGNQNSAPAPIKNDYAGNYGGDYGGDYGGNNAAAVQPPAQMQNEYAVPPSGASPNLPPPPTFEAPTEKNVDAQPAAVAQGEPQLPPLGMEGYSVITLDQDSAWKKGDKRFGAIHRGKLYLFANTEYQQKFLADPDRYSPALSGFDPVMFLEQGQLIDGKREFGIKDGSQTYLFANMETRKKFEADPSRYLQSVQQAMLRADQGSKLR